MLLRERRHWLAGGVIGALLVVVTLSGELAPRAAAQATTFVVVPQHQAVSVSASSVQVQIQVQDAVNMASFGFTLHYDPGVLTNPQVQAGPYLTSTGRQAFCPNPVLDNPAQGGPGTIQWGCASSGSGAPVNGAGLLATVVFRLAGGSTTQLTLDHVTIADPLDAAVCPSGCAAQSGSIDVTGGDASKNKGVGSATPVSGQTDAPAATPTARSTPAGQVPTVTGGNDAAASAGAAGPGTGTTALSDQAATDGAAQGRGATTGTLAGGQTGARVAKLGMGPPPPGQTRERNARLAAVTLSAAGVLALAAGVFLHARRT